MLRRVLLLSLPAVAALSFVSSNASAQDLQAPPPIQQGGPGTAPPPNNEQLQKQETQNKLNEAEAQDSGRNFELIWADAQVGGSYMDMAQFSSDDFAIRQTKAGGASFGVGAGVRLLIFYAGLRARYNVMSLYSLWKLNAEAGLKIPISSLDFMAGVHGGYAFVGSLADANKTSSDDVAVRGFNLGLDVAVDYYINSYFSVGVGVLGDVLVLNRPKVDAAKDPAYSKDGASAGLEVGGLLRLGLHLGL